MKPRTLLVLLVLVLGLGAFVYFFERKLPSSDERTARAKKVLDLESDNVHALVLEAEGKVVRLEREAVTLPVAETVSGDAKKAVASKAGDQPWHITKPLSAMADGGLVRGLLATLADLETQRLIEGADAKSLGLDPPRGSVTIETAQGRTVLDVGAAVPGTTSVVVAVRGGDEAHAVPDGIWTDLTRVAGDWRDKALFRGERGDVQSVRLQPPAGPGSFPGLLLARRGDELWLEGPLADRADRELTDRLLSQLSNLRASRFLDEPRTDSELGLEPGAGSIEVVLRGRAEPWRLALGATVDEGGAPRYARVGEQTAVIDLDLASFFAKPIEQWRSLDWSSFESWTAEGIEITDAAGTLALEREGSEWKRGTETLPYTPVSDLLVELTEAHAVRLGDSAPTALPVLTAKLKGAEREETLTLYPPTSEGLSPARVSGREAVLLLSAETVKTLVEKIATARTAQPVPKETKTESTDDVKVESEEGGE